ncbi:hypothetical protein PC116_g21315 [Phytophthora cactorum]|uniref:Uncharacterized protein n=1 Tax=Phytophthora cactorum TaxID=29920 RepID=A0A8T1K3N1_9STRA|nr:hypothetical protein PC114_g19068 [Phytophthora cactorum]KAG2899351.1 hypothetical protein PC115_g16546 [Phytophthora cactorum]KAG3145012.1 hypothetical protein C6341_g18548 [Phytophthora cactorum]KAG4230390.1 hypothetical protein PC116_g21315 [Phytophthora cactorum]
MPASHLLLSMFLFRQPGMMSHLATALVRYSSSWIKPTGTPPHVEIYKQLLHMQTSIDNLPPVLLEGMSNLIEEKGVATGNIINQMLEASIESLLTRAGIARAGTPPASNTASPSDGDNVYYFAGKFHLLPETFEFPRAGTFGAWQLWWFGNNARGWPPLKNIHPHDLPKRSMRKTFSDWVMMIKHLTDAATVAGRTIPTQPSEQHADIFEAAMYKLELSPTKHKYRLAELSLTTVQRLVREAQSATKHRRLS